MNTRATTSILLPSPRFGQRHVPLSSSLGRRRTTRSMGSAPLSPQMLSNLLWAAWGVNRQDGPFGLVGRTAASASNSQEIDIYVVMRDGAYRFEALEHELHQVTSEDLRPFVMAPGQPQEKQDIPVHLVFVADIQRLVHSAGFQEPGLQDPETQKAYYYVDTGMIAANVYLFCASEGLAAWFHHCDRTMLGPALKLREDQRVLFAQSVGYPALGASHGSRH